MIFLTTPKWLFCLIYEILHGKTKTVCPGQCVHNWLMYVCRPMYVQNIYICTSLDCHGGAKPGMYHCAVENITDFSCTQNWVSDSDGSWTVGESEFQRARMEEEKLVCTYRFVLQYEITFHLVEFFIKACSICSVSSHLIWTKMETELKWMLLFYIYLLKLRPTYHNHTVRKCSSTLPNLSAIHVPRVTMWTFWRIRIAHCPFSGQKS